MGQPQKSMTPPTAGFRSSPEVLRGVAGSVAVALLIFGIALLERISDAKSEIAPPSLVAAPVMADPVAALGDLAFVRMLEDQRALFNHLRQSRCS
jgi:hypothetical protein